MITKRINRHWGAAIGCALLTVYATPARAQPRMPTHVACVGDSITAGFGASSLAASYPAKLQTLLGAGPTVRNFGHSGATLLTTGDLPYQRTAEYTMATDFVTNAGAGAVVDVILMLGTNDSKPNNWNGGDAGTRAGQFAIDLAALIDHFATLPTHPVVYLALPLDALTNPYTISGVVIHDQIIPIINQAAAEKGLPTIDLNTPTMGQTSYFTDGVHPNDGGYDIVAGIMRDGILRVPLVSLTSPADGAMLVAPQVSLAASATGGTVAITSVEFFVDGNSAGASAQAPFSYDWSVPTAGSYALTATATDTTGAAATTDPVNVTVVVDKPSEDNKGCGCRVSAGGTGGEGGAAGAVAMAALACVRRRSRRRKPEEGRAWQRPAPQPLK